MQKGQEGNNYRWTGHSIYHILREHVSLVSRFSWNTQKKLDVLPHQAQVIYIRWFLNCQPGVVSRSGGIPTSVFSTYTLTMCFMRPSVQSSFTIVGRSEKKSPCARVRCSGRQFKVS